MKWGVLMTAEILCVGTELLLGDTINTNAAYIGKQLSKIGINVFRQSVVGDNDSRLEKSVIAALESSDILITTGGLGPTYDDITKETVSKVFGRNLSLNKEILSDIKHYFESSGRNMTKNNEKQAMIPENAIILKNTCGTAPGIILEDSETGKVAILLPGPPREMKCMFENSVLPYLAKFSDQVIISRNIRLFGIGEAALENQLHELMEKSHNPTIAPYAKEGEVLLRVTACAKDEDQAFKISEPIVNKICEKYKSYVYGVDVENLESALVKELKLKKLKISVAESCTGGLLAKRITDIAGASAVFECGVCSYSNDIKQRILKVSQENLNKFTAVSEQVAKEMAFGVRQLSGSDIGISITGVAGPGNLSEDKPEGLVYICIDTPENTKVLKLELSQGQKGQRSLIRFLASSHALFETLLEIRK